MSYIIPTSQALDKTTPVRQHFPSSLININNNKIDGVLFVDFRKAFDVISHTLLKLSFYGMSSSKLAFLSSYLADRHQFVYAHSRRSTFLRLKHCVPQRSVLGPLLFSIIIYVIELPLFLHTLYELFADDTTIHTSSKDFKIVHGTLQNCFQSYPPAKKPLVTDNILKLCDKRRELKQKNNTTGGAKLYREANEQVKKKHEKSKGNMD